MAFWHKIFKKEAAVTSAVKKEIADTKDAIMRPVVADLRPGSSRSARNITGVLRAPHTTEKTTDAAEENKYVFIVVPNANKIVVRQAVARRYGVVVESVRVLNMPPKERRRGAQTGWKQGFKKAIVSVKKGDKIELQ